MALRPIFFDTETTGVKIGQDRIVEIAAFDPEQNRTFSTLVHPETPIPEEASAIHHITDEMVANAPTFEKVAKDFIDFCKKDFVLIAHNNDTFDKPFLQAECKRVNAPLPTSWIYLDTLKWARKYRYDLPRHSLQYLREYFGIPANSAHRALDDVIILYHVYRKMTDDLPIETIYKLLYLETKTMRMPFGKFKGKFLSEIPSSYWSWMRTSGALEKEENKTLYEEIQKLGLLKG